MGNQIVGKCPVCHESMEVTELLCPTCNTRISGHFDLCKFCKLTVEQRGFAEVFIKNRGNIRDVEKELGISYPTVRGRLDALIKALGYSVESDERVPDEIKAAQRREILDRLSDGEISSSEATRLLKSLSSK